jgi:perosamine synthetase
MIPYGRQYIDEEDIQQVVEVLRSDWLTTGPAVERFEKEFSRKVGARFAVAVSNGTAALHCSMYAAGIGEGDDVIVPAMTFAASANSVVYQGGRPIFCDVDRKTLLIDPDSVKELITPATKAIVAVDYTGHPCDYEALRTIADRQGCSIIADSCHALGAEYRDKKVGTLGDMTVFSFHPVKHIATGEGGMVTTDDPELYKRLLRFRNHGITTDARQRERSGAWFYAMEDLGYNYRLTDIQCALGASQLKKLDRFLNRRRQIARQYDETFAGLPWIAPLAVQHHIRHAYHLYVVQLAAAVERDVFFAQMRQNGIGVNVHYIPVHLHPFYRRNFGTAVGDCPVAEEAYDHIVSLPMFASLTDAEIEKVIDCAGKAAGHAD